LVGNNNLFIFIEEFANELFIQVWPKILVIEREYGCFQVNQLVFNYRLIIIEITSPSFFRKLSFEFSSLWTWWLILVF